MARERPVSLANLPLLILLSAETDSPDTVVGIDSGLIIGTAPRQLNTDHLKAKSRS